MQVNNINNSPKFGQVNIFYVSKKAFTSPESADACLKEFLKELRHVTGDKHGNFREFMTMLGFKNMRAKTIVFPSVNKRSKVYFYDTFGEMTRNFCHTFLVCTQEHKNALCDKFTFKKILKMSRENTSVFYWIEVRNRIYNVIKPEEKHRFALNNLDDLKTFLPEMGI